MISTRTIPGPNGADKKPLEGLISKPRRQSKPVRVPGPQLQPGQAEPATNGHLLNLGALGIPNTSGVLRLCMGSIGTRVRLATEIAKPEAMENLGADLAATVLNTLAAEGLIPVALTGYWGSNNVTPEQARRIEQSLARACRHVGCPLASTKVAERTNFYRYTRGFELLAAALGVQDPRLTPCPEPMEEGDLIIGLPSSGIQTGDYALVKRACFNNLKLKQSYKELGEQTLGEAMLAPARMYVNEMRIAWSTGSVKAAVHVAEDGLAGKAAELVPPHLGINFHRLAANEDLPPLLRLLQKGGKIPSAKMQASFDCGYGMLLLIRRADRQRFFETMKKEAPQASLHPIGSVTQRQPNGPAVTFLPG